MAEQLNAELYERDFFEWTQTTADLVRSGRWAELDREHIAEELESLGRSDKREVVNRLKVLIMHLLNWQMVEPGADVSRSWQATIFEQRQQVEQVLDDSPSLRARLPEWVAAAYLRAVHGAIAEMRLRTNPFPQECPFSPEQILDTDFFPER
jgi:hypothetical protein